MFPPPIKPPIKKRYQQHHTNGNGPSVSTKNKPHEISLVVFLLADASFNLPVLGLIISYQIKKIISQDPESKDVYTILGSQVYKSEANCLGVQTI